MKPWTTVEQYPEERFEGLKSSLPRSELIGESGGFLRVVCPALWLDPHLAAMPGRAPAHLPFTDLSGCQARGTAAYGSAIMSSRAGVRDRSL